MHGCGSLPCATDWNLHTQLPRRLAHSGPVVGGFNIAQDPPPQPLRLPGAQGQICQEHTVTQPSNGDSGLCISSGPLEGPLLAKARRDPRHGAQKKGCYNRHFQQWFVSAVRGQTDLRPMVRRGVGPAHQLPRNASSVSSLSILPAGLSGTPCARLVTIP